MLKVVVADDEARVCKLVLMLADWASLGMEVVGTASNGIEALELVEKFQPDILVTDIRMPGCHGLDLIERAKAKYPNLEVIIISGHAHFEYAQTAIKYGVGDYLLKPIKREELMGTLEKLGQRCRERSKSATEVRQLRQDNEENVGQLQMRLPLDILNGRLEAAFSEKLWSEYRFKAQPGLYQVVMLKMDYEPGVFQSKTMAVVQEMVEKIFKNELQPVCSDLLMAFQEGWSCCLLGYSADKKDTVRKHLRNCLNQVLAQRSIFGNIEFSLALGSAVSSVEELSKSGNEARRAAANRFSDGTGRILEASTEDSRLDLDRVLEQYRHTMEHGMEAMDAGILDSAVKQLEQETCINAHARGEELLSLVTAAGRLFILRLETENREQLLHSFETSCDQCSRAGELFGCLNRLQRTQLEELNERRRNEAIRPIRIAKQYVQKHYSEPITLEDVCEVTGFSVSYFSALFKKETGEGFAKYLTRFRMEKAKELLQQTNLSVSEICIQVGYNDLKHFTQNFKKETNLNPGQYRKLYG